MPPRPFPIPLRVGTDLCSVPRIRSLLTQKPYTNKGPALKAFLSKILTHPERAYFRGRFGDDESVFRNTDNVARFLAGSEHQSQRPQALVLHEALPELEKPEAADQAAFDVEALDGQLCEISITHDGDFASAVALVPSMK
ncbi:hypothetical protein N0V95_002451 [Ascochyta clinopodiicola]|nr:hypothetical protein N0V95_002451 [Ascochyta clinopodiicola]